MKEIKIILDKYGYNCVNNTFICNITIDMWTLWGKISKDIRLSEKFITEFHNKVNWSYISGHQKLSEKFIEKFQDRVEWNYIIQYQNLSKKFIKKYKNRTFPHNLKGE